MADSNTRNESLPGIPIPSPAGSDDAANDDGGGAQRYISDTARAQQKLPPKPPSLYDLTQQAVSSIQIEDFKKAPLIPCFRESMLTSIGAGFAFGGIRLVMRASIWSACTWAAAVFVGTATFTYETCRWKRGTEKDQMLKVMHAMVEKKKRDEEKVKAARAKRAEQRVLLQEQERLRKEAEARWYKPWTWSTNTGPETKTSSEINQISDDQPKT